MGMARGEDARGGSAALVSPRDRRWLIHNMMKGELFMHYTEIKPDMTIADLVKSGVYGRLADYIFTYMTPDHWNCPLEAYGFEKAGFTEGLHRMEELAAEDGQCGASFIHKIYPEEERLANWDLQDVDLVHFPASPAKTSPYTLIIPGGGFNRQWGFIEGLAIAAHLNSLGVSAFVLFYRVKQEPVVRLAIADMYQALRYIDANADKFHVAAGQYMVGGFSAGATVAGEILSDNFGWKTAAAAKPQSVFLGYTACCMNEFYEAWAAAPEGSPAREGAASFLRRCGGPVFTKDSLEPYNLLDHLCADCPPVYITANEDDGTVPVVNSHSLDRKLTELGVEHVAKIGRTGGHSFGLGYGLEVEGWLDACVEMWRAAAERER